MFPRKSVFALGAAIAALVLAVPATSAIAARTSGHEGGAKAARTTAHGRGAKAARTAATTNAGTTTPGIAPFPGFGNPLLCGLLEAQRVHALLSGNVILFRLLTATMRIQGCPGV